MKLIGLLLTVSTVRAAKVGVEVVVMFWIVFRVIEPVPFVTVTFELPVSVALVRVFPVVFPISSWPFVYVVCPVPP